MDHLVIYRPLGGEWTTGYIMHFPTKYCSILSNVAASGWYSIYTGCLPKYARLPAQSCPLLNWNTELVYNRIIPILQGGWCTRGLGGGPGGDGWGWTRGGL